MRENFGEHRGLFDGGLRSRGGAVSFKSTASATLKSFKSRFYHNFSSALDCFRCQQPRAWRDANSMICTSLISDTGRISCWCWCHRDKEADQLPRLVGSCLIMPDQLAPRSRRNAPRCADFDELEILNAPNHATCTLETTGRVWRDCRRGARLHRHHLHQHASH